MEFEKKVPEWHKEGVEPTEERKAQGFEGGYKPPADYFNWFWTGTSQVLSEIQKAFADYPDQAASAEDLTAVANAVNRAVETQQADLEAHKIDPEAHFDIRVRMNELEALANASKSIAERARDSAAAAQDTANIASELATAAQETADYAGAIAVGAQEAATNAQQTADAATDLAGAANEKADLALSRIDQLTVSVSDDSAKIQVLWDAVFNDIVTNPFLYVLEDLDDITLTSGVWNKSLQRLEC